MKRTVLFLAVLLLPAFQINASQVSFSSDQSRHDLNNCIPAGWVMDNTDPSAWLAVLPKESYALLSQFPSAGGIVIDDIFIEKDKPAGPDSPKLAALPEPTMIALLGLGSFVFRFRS